MDSPAKTLPLPREEPSLTARAVVLGERIDTLGLERRDALSTAPLSFRVLSPARDDTFGPDRAAGSDKGPERGARGGPAPG